MTCHQLLIAVGFPESILSPKQWNDITAVQISREETTLLRVDMMTKSTGFYSYAQEEDGTWRKL